MLIEQIYILCTLVLKSEKTDEIREINQLKEELQGATRLVSLINIEYQI